jgi:peptide deformylase
MRSRYCAYALVIPEYIITTTHPANPLYRSDLKAWTEEIRRFGEETEFRQLEIQNSQQNDGTASVTFVAKLAKGKEDLSFTETSQFEKVGNRWLYRSGEVSQ